MARLEIRKLKRVSRVEVCDQPITIGRASHNTIVLRDETVSREHCIIEIIGNQPRVRDLNSRTGTMLNGTRIAQAMLQHRDRLSIGPFMLVYRDPARIPDVQTARASHSDSPHEIAGIASSRRSDRTHDAAAIEQAETMLARQTAQIAELTAAAAALHKQLLERDEQVTALQREMQSLVQQQRQHRRQGDDSRLTPPHDIAALELRLSAMMNLVQAMKHCAEHIAAIQEQVNQIEARWADADQRLGLNASNPSLRADLDGLSATLDRLNRQREAAICDLRQLADRAHKALDHAGVDLAGTAASLTNAERTHNAASTHGWWRFGVKRNR